jgi:hypothetical protein
MSPFHRQVGLGTGEEAGRNNILGAAIRTLEDLARRYPGT